MEIFPIPAFYFRILVRHKSNCKSVDEENKLFYSQCAQAGSEFLLAIYYDDEDRQPFYKDGECIFDIMSIRSFTVIQ